MDREISTRIRKIALKAGIKMNLKITDVRGHQGDASFLIDNGKTSILYDTGFGFTGYTIAENVKKCLGERKLDYIFLTHSHYDHALGSAYVLRHFPDAKVVAGKYAADIFRRDGAKRVMKDLDSKFAVTCGVTDYEFLGDELKVDIEVDEGDVVCAGDMKFKVIYLPGHTRCCIGFYLEEEGLFLSNETLGIYDGDKTIIPSCLVSYSDAIASIEKIQKLDIKTMVAPHLGLLNEAQTKFFLENMMSATKDKVADVLDSMNKGLSDEEIIKQFKDKYCSTGYLKIIYPDDAATLNTSIMVRLIRKELFQND